MKSVKWPLIVLGSMGAIFLASCSNAQPVDNSASSPNPAVLVSKAMTAGQIEPDTHTGKAHITLQTTTPLKMGKNKLILTMTDAKTGKPLAAKNVAVQMLMTAQAMQGMGMTGVGTAKTQVKSAAAPGVFEIQTSLPFGGDWQLKVNLKDVQPTSAVFNLAVK
jgi:YtkA-like